MEIESYVLVMTEGVMIITFRIRGRLELIEPPPLKIEKESGKN